MTSGQNTAHGEDDAAQQQARERKLEDPYQPHLRLVQRRRFPFRLVTRRALGARLAVLSVVLEGLDSE
jgi:hypothetical protein